MLHKHRGEQLIEELRAKKNEYPRFASYLEQLIGKVLADSQRTRKGDRERVLRLLTEFQETGLLVSDIMEDTRLSHWDVRQILDELVKAGKVEFVPKPPPGTPLKHWRKPRLYRLRRG